MKNKQPITISKTNTSKEQEVFSIGGIPDRLPVISAQEQLKYSHVLFARCPGESIEVADWVEITNAAFVAQNPDFPVRVICQVKDGFAHFKESDGVYGKMPLTECVKLRALK